MDQHIFHTTRVRLLQRSVDASSKDVGEYYPRPLRGGLGSIDYIILRNTGLSTCKLKVEAIDMVIPEELGNQSAIEYCKMVSNHSPLLANLEI